MIREAIAEDSKMLEKLYKTLSPNSKNIKVLPGRINEIKADLNNFIFVYDDTETIIGTIFLTFCLDPMYEFRPYAVIENLIIMEGSRNRGIGKKLLEHVEQKCIEKKCTKIMLMSSVTRIKAHNFFINRGYNGSISRGFKKYIPID